jgi:3,4-dihydroxy 2-butanone 4-phosphate synthase/GTP cyclohydrolase II
MNDDGPMARMPDLLELAEKHDLKIATGRYYRLQNEKRSFVHKAAETVLPTRFGEFRAMPFVNDRDRLSICVVKGVLNLKRR